MGWRAKCLGAEWEGLKQVAEVMPWLSYVGKEGMTCRKLRYMYGVL